MPDNEFHVIIDFKSVDKEENKIVKKPFSKSETKKMEDGLAQLRSLAIKRATEEVKKSLDLASSEYFSMSENYIAENAAKNIKSSINLISGTASTIFSSAKLGEAFGMGALGLGLGVATASINIGIQQYSRFSNYYKSLNAANSQTAWTAERMGLYDEGRGTEN